jgi:hypothetical protein
MTQPYVIMSSLSHELITTDQLDDLLERPEENQPEVPADLPDLDSSSHGELF